MNRAVMLRLAACGIIGLGAALLIAALLLRPTPAAGSPRSRSTSTPRWSATAPGPHWTRRRLSEPTTSSSTRTCRWSTAADQRRAPANADVVTLQVGTTLRRTDKQKDNGLLLAIIDTVTLNRTTAMAVSGRHPRGGVGAEAARHQRREPADPMPLRHEG